MLDNIRAIRLANNILAAKQLLSAITSAQKKQLTSFLNITISSRMFYNILEKLNTIMVEIAKIIKNNISLDILRQNIFPDRPEEAANFGCKSLST